jgi:hypothetical protein
MLTAPQHAQTAAARRGLRRRRSPRSPPASASAAAAASASPRAVAVRQQAGVEHRMKRRALDDWARAQAELVAIEHELSSTRREIAVLSPKVSSAHRSVSQWEMPQPQPEPEPEPAPQTIWPAADHEPVPQLGGAASPGKEHRLSRAAAAAATATAGRGPSSVRWQPGGRGGAARAAAATAGRAGSGDAAIAATTAADWSSAGVNALSLDSLRFDPGESTGSRSGHTSKPLGGGGSGGGGGGGGGIGNGRSTGR